LTNFSKDALSLLELTPHRQITVPFNFRAAVVAKRSDGNSYFRNVSSFWLLAFALFALHDYWD